jgi:hypothetical protein
LAHSEARRAFPRALLAVLALACTELAPGSDTLLEQPMPLETSTRNAQLDEKWACLGMPAPASAVALRPQVAFSLGLNDPATGAAPADASVRACTRFDIDCGNPVQGPTPLADDGLFHLMLPRDFNGFLEITSAAIIPELYYFNPALRSDRQDEFIILSLATAQGLAASGNIVIDPELGMVAVRTMDCQGQLSAGVQFSNDVGGGIPFAFIDGLPVPGYEVTNEEGLGGFANVRTGTVVVQGQETGSGQISGTSSIVVRKGWLTIGDLNPALQ